MGDAKPFVCKLHTMFTIPFHHWPHLIRITLCQPTNSHQRLRHKVPRHEHQISLSHQPSDILRGPKSAPSGWVVIGPSLLINIKILHAADFQAIIHLGQCQLHRKGKKIRPCWESSQIGSRVWLQQCELSSSILPNKYGVYKYIICKFIWYKMLFLMLLIRSLLSILSLVTYSFTNMPSFCSRMLSPS